MEIKIIKYLFKITLSNSIYCYQIFPLWHQRNMKERYNRKKYIKLDIFGIIYNISGDMYIFNVTLIKKPKNIVIALLIHYK